MSNRATVDVLPEDIILELSGRLSGRRVRQLGAMIETAMAETAEPDIFIAWLWDFIERRDDREGYNLLWAMTHMSPSARTRLVKHPDQAMQLLYGTRHTGKRRLILNLLQGCIFGPDEINPAFLDFCLSRINSTEPYGVRSLCLKLAFAQCCHFPELLRELLSEIEMMDSVDLSPGLRTTRNHITRSINRRMP